MIDPNALYQQRSAEFGAAAATYDQRARRQGNISLGLFFGAIVLLIVALWNDNTVLTAVAVLCIVAFVASLVYRNRLNRLQRRFATLQALNQEGLYRLARQWDGLPLPPPAAANAAPSLARRRQPTTSAPGARATSASACFSAPSCC